MGSDTFLLGSQQSRAPARRGAVAPVAVVVARHGFEKQRITLTCISICIDILDTTR